MCKKPFIQGNDISKIGIEYKATYWERIGLKIKVLVYGENDFELSEIGDLAMYSYEDLKKYVLSLNNGFEIRKKIIVSDKFIAVFESKKSRFEILYYTDGSFIWKLHDEWLK